MNVGKREVDNIPNMTIDNLVMSTVINLGLSIRAKEQPCIG